MAGLDRAGKTGTSSSTDRVGRFAEIMRLKQQINQDTAADAPDLPSASPHDVAISLIDLPASQPRKYFDSEKQRQLVLSIQEKGILEPLLVRPSGAGRYELVAGERRYRAAKEIGLSNIPVTVRELTDREAIEIALIENLQREDLNPVEETEGILKLLSLKLELTIPEVESLFSRLHNEHAGKVTSNVTCNSVHRDLEAILEAVGQNWLSFYTNRLPLLKLPENILTVLRQGKLEYTKAKAIARVKDPEKRQELLQQAIDGNYSLSQIRQVIADLQPAKITQPNLLQNKVKDTFSLLRKVKLLPASKQKKLDGYLDKIQALLADGDLPIDE